MALGTPEIHMYQNEETNALPKIYLNYRHRQFCIGNIRMKRIKNSDNKVSLKTCKNLRNIGSAMLIISEN